MPQPPAQKVVVLPLCENLLLQSDGTTSFSTLVQALPEAEEWGPHVESIQVMTVTKHATANFEWKVQAGLAVDGHNAMSTTDLSGTMSADDQDVHTAVSSNITARKLRFLLACRNSTGSATESALASAWLIFTFKS